MTLIDPDRLRPKQDNVLVRLDMHANAQAEERRLTSGLYVPKTADDGAGANHGDAVPATIVAVGPGRWTDSWRDQEKGSVPHGDGFWLAMHSALVPGARVLVDSPDQGDKVFARDQAAQYRLVREENVVMVLGDDPVPLGDRVLVAPGASEQVTDGGIILSWSERDKPTEGEVLAVAAGRRLHDGTTRAVDVREGDVVVHGRFAGTKVVLQDVELLLLREEDVLAVVAT